EFERVRTMLEPKGPSEDLAFAYINLARLASMDLETQEVLALVERGTAVAIQANADAPRIWAYQYRGSTLADLGQTEEGLRDLDRSYHEAVEHDLDWIASSALFNGIEAREVTFRAQEALAQ